MRSSLRATEKSFASYDSIRRWTITVQIKTRTAIAETEERRAIYHKHVAYMTTPLSRGPLFIVAIVVIVVGRARWRLSSSSSSSDSSSVFCTWSAPPPLVR